MSEVQDADLLHYEGLVWKTAQRYAAIVQEDFDDVRQVLRVKVWRALLSFDPSRSSMSRDRYVFSCVRNQVKDLLKRNRPNLLFIDDVASVVGTDNPVRDSFENRYLSTDHDEVYAEVEDELPAIPSTLDAIERQIVVLLFLNFSHAEAAQSVRLTKAQFERRLEGIRDKMADWKPSAEPQPQRLAA